MSAEPPHGSTAPSAPAPDPADGRPHRRYNPLADQWVLVSPHRAQRPWLGQTEPAARESRPPYDPTCYLCPGNRRAQGQVNPAYDSTYAFDNDFSALLPDAVTDPPGEADAAPGPGALFRREAVRGRCRVLCFSPRHDLTLAQMSPAELTAVVDLWTAETAAAGAEYRWVQVFENKGAVMGCSNPHPHGQVWASSALPTDAAVEDRQQHAYARQHRSSLLLDYAARELERGVRIVHQTAGWLAVVPFWAVWPFETLILPRRAVARLTDLTAHERAELAAFLKVVLVAYDPCSTCRFRTRWAGMARPSARAITPARHPPAPRRARRHLDNPGSCTPTSTRRCCGRRR